MYNLNYTPKTTLGVQSWREIISGGTRTRKVEYRCSSSNAPDLYSKGARFKSRTGHRLSWLGFLVVLLSLCWQMAGYNLKLAHSRFFPVPSQFISHHSSLRWVSTASASGSVLRKCHSSQQAFYLFMTGKISQEVLGRTDCLLSFDTTWTHRKRSRWLATIRGLLPSRCLATIRELLSSRCLATIGGCTDTYKQQHDLISLLYSFKIGK
jgi:hypothetical protein